MNTCPYILFYKSRPEKDYHFNRLALACLLMWVIRTRGYGLSLIDCSRRIHGSWSITVGLGFDKKWTEKTDGTERTDSYSISSTIAYDVTLLELFGAPASMSVLGGAAQDFSSYNEMTGRRDEDLGTSVGGGLSFAWPVAERWAISLSPLMAYELDSSELSLEMEFSGSYSF